jgi:adenosylhomocysteine nucleosidase
MKGVMVIVFAVASELELRGLRRMIEVDRKEVHGGKLFYFGHVQEKDVCLVRTGAGRKNAASAARKIQSLLQPDFVVIAGAAGALDPAFELGAVVIVESVVRENISDEICRATEAASQALVVLNTAGMKARAGRCFQVAAFMHRASDKQALHGKTGAHIVDMESAAFAVELQAAGVPYVNIRIVSDTAQRDTADMETLVRLRYRRGKAAAVLHLLRHPREFMRTLFFFRGMAIADKRIAGAVNALMAADVFREKTGRS